MRKILAISALGVFIFMVEACGAGVAFDATPTAIVLPEGYLVNESRSFPSSSLFCDEATNVAEGQTWNGVIVGASTQGDLLNVLEEIGGYDIGVVTNVFTASFDDREAFRLEPLISACLYNGIVTTLKLSYVRRPFDSAITWESFLLEYGKPDAVTWSQGFAGGRVMFWFEDGVALEVSNLSDSIGVVTIIVYFAPIELEGYENQYPYNRTWSPDTPDLADVYGEQNPFDFEAIIATLTAEPSRTPTPTFSPRVTQTPSTTPTVTRTPTPGP